MSDHKVKNKIIDFFSFERVEPMFSGGGRDWSVDVLRCLSCFMVCAIHATRMSVDNGISDMGSNPWLHNEIYSTIVASPTVLFVMVSGIFFLSPERNVRASKIWRKNVIKMAFAYIFWCLIYALHRIYIMDPVPDITFDFFIRQWMVQPTHLWYIPMIIGLYIISPIIRPITATGDTKLFRYTVLIFIGGLILWTIYVWPTHVEGTYSNIIIGKTPMNLLCQYPFWMIYGWIAYTYRPKKAFRYLIYGFGIIAILIGIYANYYMWSTTGNTSFTATTQQYSIVSFVKNTAIFYFVVTTFRDHEFSRFGKFFLRKWSDYTLIIYLVHFLILVIMFQNNFLYGDGVSPWIGVWLYALIAYVGGGILALLFHLIWDPIKKVLFTKKS